MGSRSTDRLVAALKEAGAPPDVVLRATADHFHDFKSASATPIMDLVAACEAAGLHAVAERAKDGEFDADPSESVEWVRSRDGQATLTSSPPVEALAALLNRMSHNASCAKGKYPDAPCDEITCDLDEARLSVDEMRVACRPRPR